MEMQRETSGEGNVPVGVTDPDLQNLLNQATDKAAQMGHTLGEWDIEPSNLVRNAQNATAYCLRCKATISVRQGVASHDQILGDAIIDVCLTHPAAEV